MKRRISVTNEFMRLVWIGSALCLLGVTGVFSLDAKRDEMRSVSPGGADRTQIARARVKGGVHA